MTIWRLPQLKAWEGELWPFTSPETIGLGLYVAFWVGVIVGAFMQIWSTP